MQKLEKLSSAIYNNSYYHDRLSLHGILTNKFNTNAKYGGNYNNYHKLNQAKCAEEEYEAIYFHRRKCDRLKDYKNLLYCLSDYGIRFYKTEKMTHYTRSIIHCKKLKISYYGAKRRDKGEYYEN